MTVAELIEELQDVRGDAEVKCVKNGVGYDSAYEIASVGYYDSDVEFVQIEMAASGTRIGD